MQQKKVVSLLFFLTLWLNSSLGIYAQSTENGNQPFSLFMPLVSSSDNTADQETDADALGTALIDEAFVEPEFSADDSVISAASTTTTLLPTRYATTSGTSGGQPVTNLHLQDQAGTQNDWNKYVELLTPGSAKYIGYRSYTLPAAIDPATITAIQLKANYLGPVKSYQSWTWTIYNWSTKQWVSIGDNNGALAWQWKLFTFNVGGTLKNYINSSTREMQVRLQSNNTKDNMDLDYETLLVTANTSTTSLLQKVAVPSYFYPGESYWSQLESGAPTVGLAIINPNSGVGTARDPNYVTQTNSTKAKGITVIGYVYTSYGSRTAATIKAEIDQYYQWYGVDGIFFDEVYYADCAKVTYYQDLYNYIKAKGGQAKVVINPGINFPECMLATSDIAINFEDSYANYLNWKPSGWESTYPANRFWHLVIAATQAQMPNAIALAKQRNAGWIYVTPDVLDNPWDTLPPAPYWSDELYRASH